MTKSYKKWCGFLLIFGLWMPPTMTMRISKSFFVMALVTCVKWSSLDGSVGAMQKWYIILFIWTRYRCTKNPKELVGPCDFLWWFLWWPHVFGCVCLEVEFVISFILVGGPSNELTTNLGGAVFPYGRCHEPKSYYIVYGIYSHSVFGFTQSWNFLL